MPLLGKIMRYIVVVLFLFPGSILVIGRITLPRKVFKNMYFLLK